MTELSPTAQAIPPSHDSLFGVSERALLCQTAEGYAKLRAGLPAHTHSRLSPERPGSAENLFVDGLSQWELCIGDEFEAGKGTRRRDCHFMAPPLYLYEVSIGRNRVCHQNDRTLADG